MTTDNVSSYVLAVQFPLLCLKTLLNIGIGIRMNILMLDTRNVEQTKNVRMYTCRIYSSRDLDTLLHKVEDEILK